MTGSVTLTLRRRLAAEGLCAHGRLRRGDLQLVRRRARRRRRPPFRALGGAIAEVLRYGENPHQTAAFYRTPEQRPGVATARQVQGKQLSYNNINDTDAAYEAWPNSTRARRRHASSSSTPIRAASPRARRLREAYREGAALRPGLGFRRHRRDEPHARRGGRQSHRRDFHRSDHRARRDRGGHRHRRRRRRTCACCSPAACPIPARRA